MNGQDSFTNISPSSDTQKSYQNYQNMQNQSTNNSQLLYINHNIPYQSISHKTLAYQIHLKNPDLFHGQQTQRHLNYKSPTKKDKQISPVSFKNRKVFQHCKSNQNTKEVKIVKIQDPENELESENEDSDIEQNAMKIRDKSINKTTKDNKINQKKRKGQNQNDQDLYQANDQANKKALIIQKINQSKLLIENDQTLVDFPTLDEVINQEKILYGLSKKTFDPQKRDEALSNQRKKEEAKSKKSQLIEHLIKSNQPYKEETKKKGQASEKKKEQGLPNIGNTCFLNSALQMLFSAGKLRENLTSANFLSHEGSLLDTLGQIFKAINSGMDDYKKKKLLLKFTSNLRNLHENYEHFSQQDSFDFLNLIIQTIGSLCPAILDMFRVQYFSKCECVLQSEGNSSKMNISYSNLKCEDYSLPLGKQQCTECNMEVQTQMERTPSYLVCMGIKRIKGNDQIFFKKTNEETYYKYKLCAKIIYSGSGTYGHYISYRKDVNGKFVFIDDNRMKNKLDHYDNEYGYATVYLYELDQSSKMISKKDIKPNYQKIYDPNQYIEQRQQYSKTIQEEEVYREQRIQEKQIKNPLKKIIYNDIPAQSRHILRIRVSKLQQQCIYKGFISVLFRKQEEIQLERREIYFLIQFQIEKANGYFNILKILIRILNKINFFFLKEEIIEIYPNQLPCNSFFDDLLICLENKLLKEALENNILKERKNDFYRENFKSSKIKFEMNRCEPIRQFVYR